MEVFGHDDIAEDDEAMALPDFFQQSETGPMAGGFEQLPIVF
jgi:hypothetical protein